MEFDVVSQLYANPSDLSVLPTNRLRLLARAIIQQVRPRRHACACWRVHAARTCMRACVLAPRAAAAGPAGSSSCSTPLATCPVTPAHRLQTKRLTILRCTNQAVDERYHAIYLEATNTSKELAKTGLKDVIPDSAGKVRAAAGISAVSVTCCVCGVLLTRACRS